MGVIDILNFVYSACVMCVPLYLFVVPLSIGLCFVASFPCLFRKVLGKK